MKNSIPLGFIRIFILLICLTSCGSKKQQKVALPADFKGPKELARLYGVRITPEDNIFLYNEVLVGWVRHKLGGSTKRGVDCSGFVSIVYREVYGKQLARSSADMLKYNCKKVSRAKLQERRSGIFQDGSWRETWRSESRGDLLEKWALHPYQYF